MLFLQVKRVIKVYTMIQRHGFSQSLQNEIIHTHTIYIFGEWSRDQQNKNQQDAQ